VIPRKSNHRKKSVLESSTCIKQFPKTIAIFLINQSINQSKNRKFASSMSPYITDVSLKVANEQQNTHSLSNINIPKLLILQLRCLFNLIFSLLNFNPRLGCKLQLHFWRLEWLLNLDY
jgi:hypothetical protein